ncbi:MAG: ATP-binding protein [Chitinophagaceae bacterium]
MKNPVKILIAEHDKHDVELMQYELSKTGIDCVYRVVQTEAEFIIALKDFIPDLILSDYTFPAFSGPETFRLRQQIAPCTPFIFVSGIIGEEKSIELIKTGVTDYALKDKLFTLGFKVMRALKESEEQTEKRKIEQELAISERLLARAQQLAHIGNWELDISTDSISWSAQANSIHEMTVPQQLQSLESWMSVIHPDDARVIADKIITTRCPSAGFSFQYRVLSGQGSIKYIHAESNTELDAAGIPKGLYGTVQDITERVLLEDKLTEERRSRQIEITAAVLTAQEKERASIGEELHDNLNQILGAAKMYIELAKTDRQNKQSLLDRSSGCIVSVIEKIRAISKILAGPGIQVGLFNSIRILIADSMIASAIKIRLQEHNLKEIIINEKLRLTIFRIVQEQVNNILKHSNATSATINLYRLGNEVLLNIKDNGAGTDFLKQTQGVGIQNIRSRAGLHDGNVILVSKPGKGYELKVAMALGVEPAKTRSAGSLMEIYNSK